MGEPGLGEPGLDELLGDFPLVLPAGFGGEAKVPLPAGEEAGSGFTAGFALALPLFFPAASGFAGSTLALFGEGEALFGEGEASGGGEPGSGRLAGPLVERRVRFA